MSHVARVEFHRVKSSTTIYTWFKLKLKDAHSRLYVHYLYLELKSHAPCTFLVYICGPAHNLNTLYILLKAIRKVQARCKTSAKIKKQVSFGLEG